MNAHKDQPMTHHTAYVATIHTAPDNTFLEVQVEGRVDDQGRFMTDTYCFLPGSYSLKKEEVNQSMVRDFKAFRCNHVVEVKRWKY